MTIHQQYDRKIKAELEPLIQEVDKALAHDPMRELLHGWRVLFSPLLERPQVMFIGINPGAGEPGNDIDHTNKETRSTLEYVRDSDNDYALARETRAVFEAIGKLELLRTSAVKTNFFFMSTRREKELFQLIDRLNGAGKASLTRDALFAKAWKWTRALIEMVKPRIVICEGKTAYSSVLDAFSNDVASEWSDWGNGCAYTQIDALGLVIIGYSRHFSHIRNKERLGQLIQRFLNE